ncbi:hypothetical protein ASD23_01100 [Agromyces sp. Root1464]|nr:MULTISPECIES: ABC transporter substrate-binding protein [Agromyces]KQZ10794.1 hypothetical protein ASD23_01100 [Agromyces sp. Root1464]
MRRIPRIALVGASIAAAATVALSGCAPSAAPAPDPSASAGAVDDVTIRVGAQPVFALSQWWAAQELGYFDENEVNVELAELYPNGAPQVEAGLRGDWDIAFTGELPAINAGRAWELQTIGFFGNEPHAHGVYVKSDSGITAKNADDKLAGQPVLFTQGSTDQLFFEGCLDQFGLSISDIDAVNLAPVDLVAAMQSGNGVAASAYPPFAFQLEADGYENICDTSKLDVAAYPTMVVRKEFLEEHPDAVARFTEAVFRANALFASDPEQALELAQGFYEETGVTQTEEDLKRTIDLYEWVDLPGGIDIFESGDAADSVNAYQEMLVRNGTATDVTEPIWLNDSAMANALLFADGR